MRDVEASPFNHETIKFNVQEMSWAHAGTPRSTQISNIYFVAREWEVTASLFLLISVSVCQTESSIFDAVSLMGSCRANKKPILALDKSYVLNMACEGWHESFYHQVGGGGKVHCTYVYIHIYPDAGCMECLPYHKSKLDVGKYSIQMEHAE